MGEGVKKRGRNGEKGDRGRRTKEGEKTGQRRAHLNEGGEHLVDVCVAECRGRESADTAPLLRVVEAKQTAPDQPVLDQTQPAIRVGATQENLLGRLFVGVRAELKSGLYIVLTKKVR